MEISPASLQTFNNTIIITLEKLKSKAAHLDDEIRTGTELKDSLEHQIKQMNRKLGEVVDKLNNSIEIIQVNFLLTFLNLKHSIGDESFKLRCFLKNSI